MINSCSRFIKKTSSSSIFLYRTRCCTIKFWDVREIEVQHLKKYIYFKFSTRNNWLQHKLRIKVRWSHVAKVSKFKIILLQKVSWRIHFTDLRELSKYSSLKFKMISTLPEFDIAARRAIFLLYWKNWELTRYRLEAYTWRQIETVASFNNTRISFKIAFPTVPKEIQLAPK